jgi:hypothetical protein
MADNDKEDKKKKPYIGPRKLVKIGSTVYVSIPKEFLESNDISEEEISEGTEVTCMANKDFLITKDPDRVDEMYEMIEKFMGKSKKKIAKKDKK